MKIDKLLNENQLNHILGLLVEVRHAQEQAYDQKEWDALNEALRSAIVDIKRTGDTDTVIPGFECHSREDYINTGRKCLEFTENGQDAEDVNLSAFGEDVVATFFSTEFKHDMQRLPFENINIYMVERPVYDEDGDVDGYECLGFYFVF